MKIDQTRKLLYDYVRGMLSAEERDLVEQELGCSEELRNELKKVQLYYGAIGSVESVSVPENFLENVHRRIESRGKKDVVTRLFIPLHIRLPVELAGIVATVVLVVFLFIPQLERKNFSVYAPLPPQERGIPSIEKSVESMDFDKKMSKQEEMSGTSVDKSERQVNNEIPAAKSKLMCNKKVRTRSEVAKQKGDDAVVAEQKPASPDQSPSVPATVHENQSLQSASGSDMKEMPPAAVPSEKQMSEDNNYAKKTEEIQKKILSLESKRAHFKSSGSSYRGEVSKNYLPDEDILSVNEDITALLLHCRMKWTVIDSVSGVKTYSANGTVRSVELFLKKIKGRSDIKILKTVPEDYESAVDNVIVEFTVFKR